MKIHLFLPYYTSSEVLQNKFHICKKIVVFLQSFRVAKYCYLSFSSEISFQEIYRVDIFVNFHIRDTNARTNVQFSLLRESRREEEEEEEETDLVNKVAPDGAMNPIRRPSSIVRPMDRFVAIA